jgi:peptidoglycan hydrolase-like protein with peptidoglycan-binding domain
VPAGAAAPRAAVAATSEASVEAQFVAKINAARAAAGLRGYAVRDDLAAVAEAQARRMAAQNRLYHNPNLASEVRNYRWAGENVGYGPGVDVLHEAFMESSGHRSNILDRDFTQVGLGAVWAGDRLWVAQVFREPTEQAAGGVQVAAAQAGARSLQPAAASSHPARAAKVTAEELRAARAARAKAVRPMPGTLLRERPRLQYGQRSAWVTSVQRRLGVPQTGYFGTATKQAVSRFQRGFGLAVTGRVNLDTWRAMGWPTTRLK